MKRNTPGCRKMKRLQRMLRLELFEAVGVLELLWHFAAREAPAGDIGKYTDEEIEDVIGWPVKKTGKLVPALILSKWLDESPEHRLIIHDWSDHSDDSVDRYLARTNQQYADGSGPRNRVTRRDGTGTKDDASKRDMTGHDASVTKSDVERRVVTTSRARGLMPDAGSLKPDLSPEDEREAFETLISEPKLAAMTAAQWLMARRNLAGHPAFRLVAWAEFAKKTAEAAAMRTEIREPAVWVQAALERWLNDAHAQKNPEKTRVIDPGEASRQ